MIMPDVNVLIHAFDRHSDRHGDYRDWLDSLLSNVRPFGISDLVLSAVIRISTHPKIFATPASSSSAVAFTNTIRDCQNCVPIAPGPRHWQIFTQLCVETGCKGGLVSDAYFAALAIESGSEWITTDRDFSRFPGLKWRHPFDARI